MHASLYEGDGQRPALALHLLSSFQVYVDGEPTNGRLAGKARELLKILATHYRTPLPREVLIELLWPGSDPEVGAVSLKVTAHNLRRALEPNKASRQPGNWILAQNGSYRLNPHGNVWIDVQALKHHYERAMTLANQRRHTETRSELRTVEELYAGDLLEMDVYEDWTILWREELRDIYLDAISRLAGYASSERKHSEAIRLCHKIVLADPCREDAYRLLMTSHAALNQYGRAGAWYAVCRQALKRETDTVISAETSALFERLF